MTTRVLLLGNGPSAARYNVVKDIEEYDLVVRFNCWHRDPETVGDRCDLWITNLSPHDTVHYLPRAAREGYKCPWFIVSPGKGKSDSSRVLYFKELIQESWPDARVESIPNTVPRKLNSIFRRKPTTGVVAIQHFLELGYDVTIHGFDIVFGAACEGRHYWGGKSNIRKSHNPSVEGKWLRERLDKGEIKMLRDITTEPISVSTFEGQPEVIPRKLHMVWLGSEPPALVQANITRLVELHPGWEFMLHTDLPESADPELCKAYDAAEQWCQRADIVRYVAMRDHGGIYIDSDCVPLRNLEPLLAVGPLWGARQADRRFNNCVMGCVRGCDAIEAVLEGVREAYRASVAAGNGGAPIKRADYGPNLLTRLKREGLDDLREVMKHYFMIYDRSKSAHNFLNASDEERQVALEAVKGRIHDDHLPFVIHLWGIEGSSKRRVGEKEPKPRPQPQNPDAVKKAPTAEPHASSPYQKEPTMTDANTEIRQLFHRHRNLGFKATAVYQSIPELGVEGARPTDQRSALYGLRDRYASYPDAKVLNIGGNSGAFEIHCSDAFKKGTVLEGSKVFASMARRAVELSGVNNVEVIEQTLENFETSAKFDVVLLLAVHKYLKIGMGEVAHRLCDLTKPGSSVLIESHVNRERDRRLRSLRQALVDLGWEFEGRGDSGGPDESDKAKRRYFYWYRRPLEDSANMKCPYPHRFITVPLDKGRLLPSYRLGSGDGLKSPIGLILRDVIAEAPINRRDRFISEIRQALINGRFRRTATASQVLRRSDWVGAHPWSKVARLLKAPGNRLYWALTSAPPEVASLVAQDDATIIPAVGRYLKNLESIMEHGYVPRPKGAVVANVLLRGDEARGDFRWVVDGNGCHRCNILSALGEPEVQVYVRGVIRREEAASWYAVRNKGMSVEEAQSLFDCVYDGFDGPWHLGRPLR